MTLTEQMTQAELRKQFVDKVNSDEGDLAPGFQTEDRHSAWRVLTVAIKLPSGGIETITNTMDIESKILYYLQNYDDEFRMVRNTEIKIIGFMLV